jgi:hypothetical protein
VGALLHWGLGSPVPKGAGWLHCFFVSCTIVSILNNTWYCNIVMIDVVGCAVPIANQLSCATFYLFFVLLLNLKFQFCLFQCILYETCTFG